MEKEKNGLKEERFVSINDPYFIILKELMIRDVSIIYYADQTRIKSWFYNAEKDKDFENSVYTSKKNRDRVAFSKTEVFRKTFFKNNVKKYTPDFLNTIVSKIRLLENVNDWEQFKSWVNKLFHPGFDELYIYFDQNAHLPALQGVSREEYTAKLCATVIFTAVVSRERVFLYDDLGKPIQKVAAVHEDTGEIVIQLTTKEMIEHNRTYNRKWTKGEKVILYNEWNFISKNSMLFFRIMCTSIFNTMSNLGFYSLFPLNNKGETALLNGELFFKTLSPDMVYAPAKMEQTKSLLLDFGFFSHNYRSFQRAVYYLVRYLNINVKEIMIYMTDDTIQKQNIIKIFSMKKVCSKRILISDDQNKKKFFNSSIYGISLTEMDTHSSLRKVY